MSGTFLPPLSAGCFVYCAVVRDLGMAGRSMVRGDWIGLNFVFGKVFACGFQCCCGVVVCVRWNMILISVM